MQVKGLVDMRSASCTPGLDLCRPGALYGASRPVLPTTVLRRMSRRRKSAQYHSGWMLSVVFNSLLILMPVIAHRTIVTAYAGAGFAETPNVDSMRLTRERIDAAFADLAPRGSEAQMLQWNERISDALAARDTSTLRGLLLASPQLLGADLGGQIMLRANADARGTPDERVIRASLTLLPLELAAEIEAAAAPAREAAPAPESEPLPVQSGEDVAEDPPAAMTAAADRISAPPDPDRRFQMLGTYGDLAALSNQWLTNNRRDNLVIKLTGFGLVQRDAEAAPSDAIARAASILKSAARSNRLEDSFSAEIEALVNAALPDSRLQPALNAAFDDFVTSDVRGERVRDAFTRSIDPDGAAALEKDLLHIDRIATLTSPAGALTMIERVRDSTDLRRARLLAESGGDRAIALVKYGGDEALSIANPGIRWTRNMVLEVMSLTAAGMVLFWVMVSALRFYIKKPRPKHVPVV